MSGLSQSDFGIEIGRSKNTIINWERGETSPTQKDMNIIVQKFGHFIKENKQEVTILDRTTTSVKVVDVKAQAGYLTGYKDPEYMDSLPFITVNEQFDRGGYYMAFTVNGDSMDDGTSKSLLHGDVILGKELQKHHWNNKIHFNQYPFVIVSIDGIVFKDIIEHDTDRGIITLHSRNPLYEDYKLRLKDIYQIFYIVQLVERKLKM